MAKPRVFIVHRWEGSPNSDWYPWLKQKLAKEGVETVIVELPHPEWPQIDTWVKTLKGAVHGSDEQTFFVGHSVGCQTILRYLETIPDAVQVGGVVLVAGWLALKPAALEDEQAKAVADPWLHRPLHWTLISKHVPAAALIASDNDPLVSLEDQHILRTHLKATIKIEHNAGHLTGEDGFTELPSAFATVMGQIKTRL